MLLILSTIRWYSVTASASCAPHCEAGAIETYLIPLLGIGFISKPGSRLKCTPFSFRRNSLRLKLSVGISATSRALSITSECLRSSKISFSCRNFPTYLVVKTDAWHRKSDHHAKKYPLLKVKPLRSYPDHSPSPFCLLHWVQVKAQHTLCCLAAQYIFLIVLPDSWTTYSRPLPRQQLVSWNKQERCECWQIKSFTNLSYWCTQTQNTFSNSSHLYEQSLILVSRSNQSWKKTLIAKHPEWVTQKLVRRGRHCHRKGRMMKFTVL